MTADYSQLCDRLSSLHSLCMLHGLQIPTLVRFWLRASPQETRVSLFGPKAGDLAALLEKLAYTAIDEHQLRNSIVEIRQVTSDLELLAEDGSRIELAAEMIPDASTKAGDRVVLVKRGEMSSELRFSAALCGARQLNLRALRPEDWIERISLPVIVTSVSAPFGKIETDFIESLIGNKRPFLVVLLGFDAEAEVDRSDAFTEIEKFRINPLRSGERPFSLAYDLAGSDKVSEKLADDLRGWLKTKSGQAQEIQLLRVAMGWLPEIKIQLNKMRRESQDRLRYLDVLSAHLVGLRSYVDDLTELACQEAARRLDEYRYQVQTAAVAALDRSPKDQHPNFNLESFQRQLDALLNTMPAKLQERINAGIAAEIAQFRSTSSELLGNLPEIENRIEIRSLNRSHLPLQNSNPESQLKPQTTKLSLFGIGGSRASKPIDIYRQIEARIQEAILQLEDFITPLLQAEARRVVGDLTIQYLARIELVRQQISSEIPFAEFEAHLRWWHETNLSRGGVGDAGTNAA